MGYEVLMLPGFNTVFNVCNHICTRLNNEVFTDTKLDCFFGIDFHSFNPEHVFFPVLVSESTSQIEKVREKNGIHLSDKLANSGWASCQHSHTFKKTAVCEPIPLRPLEES